MCTQWCLMPESRKVNRTSEEDQKCRTKTKHKKINKIVSKKKLRHASERESERKKLNLRRKLNGHGVMLNAELLF